LLLTSPPSEPESFAYVQRIFGAGNVNKVLQDLPIHKRADAVASMVFEAYARVRDPVYGSAGTILSMQKSLEQLKMHLSIAVEEILQMREQLGWQNTSTITTALRRLLTMEGASLSMAHASSSEARKQTPALSSEARQPFFEGKVEARS